MKSHRYLARSIALLVVLILALIISYVLVTGQEAGPWVDPKAVQFDNPNYFPLVVIPHNTIVGRVTDAGAAAPNVGLELRFYNGATWTTISNKTTNLNGEFSFTGINHLLQGQKYEVQYHNPGKEQSHLWSWETRELTSFSDGSVVNIGNFDIANIALGEPYHLSIVKLARIFYWTARPATPTDIYEFKLFDYNDSLPSFSSANLGYASGYYLGSLPAGFLNCIPYAWGLAIHSPDGGRGTPYWYNAVTFYPATPSGIHGCVAESGVPRSGIQVNLYRLNTATQVAEDLGPTTTNASGYFAFTGKPALDATHSYFVRYPNNEHNTTRLWEWHTRNLTSYTAGSSVHIGDFDIATVPLHLPADGATVNLPETFSWTRRPGLQAESYEFDLFESCNGCLLWWTDPPLGYADHYSLLGLPAGFVFGDQYWWYLTIYSPYDSAYGFSYQVNGVTFSSTATSAESTGTLTEAQREQIRNQRMLRSLQARPQEQPGLHPAPEQPEQ